jgi:hypothetical protein
MKDSPSIGKVTLLGIFLCSAATISYEITLTRLFSISLSYHFAFMVLSIAMLGIGLSGTLQSIHTGFKSSSRLGLYALLLAMSVILGHIFTKLVPFDPARLQWERVQLLYIALHYIILSVPFVFFGLIVSTSLSEFSGQSGLVYGADLLGAGIGSAAVIILMNATGPEKSLLYISSTALAGSFLMGKRKGSVVLLLVFIVILGFAPDIMTIRMSPYKELQQALRYPGAEHIMTYQDGFSRIDVFKSPAARFAPGLSLMYLENLPAQTGLSVDGSGVSAITKAEDGPPGFVEFMPNALAYETRKRQSTLIIDPKGGLPVLMARKYGVTDIQSIESIPLIVDVIRNDFMKFSGNMFADGTHKGLARNWLKSAERGFDVIDLSLTGALPHGSFGISEDYGLTVEAFVQYLRHLNDNGVLSLSAYILPPPRTELRLLNTAIAALEDLGITDACNNIAAIRSWGSICILVKTSAFTSSEIKAMKEFSASRGFDIVYYPGVREEETNVYIRTPGNDYHRAAVKTIMPDSRERFREDYIFDIAEAYDDRPFFSYHMSLGNIREIYDVMGGKWMYFLQEGYLLPAVLIQAAFLSTILLALPLIYKRKTRVGPSPDLIYFALLGLGYMSIEVALIQKMILPFVSPSRAVATVLASVLICSGFGSLLGQRFPDIRRPVSIVLLAIVAALYGLFLPAISDSISPLAMHVKLPLAFLLIMPAGILMGIPFPLGIRVLGEKNQPLIPWAWAVNGCFSVIAPIVAYMLAMAVGFRVVFFTGAALYALAYVVGKRTIFTNNTKHFL